MKQTCSILSTYTADISGVCSALYEMGGMTVMHDASGCNSTYNTHDEPRWYHTPSMVFISALSELEAVMGDDEKLINDVSAAAVELQPRFIAIGGTPIPMMMGTDLSGIARVIEKKTGIPTFGFPTNSMHSYVTGAGMALAAVAERFCVPLTRPDALKKGEKPVINLLGVTPLDFSVTGNVEAMKKLFTDSGYKIQGCWAMGSAWEELMNAGRAHVNVVASSCGLPLARVLQRIYGSPFVCGVPMGRKLPEAMFEGINVRTGDGAPVYVVGEEILSLSIKNALCLDYGMKNVRVLCPLEETSLLSGADYALPDEEDIFARLKDASVVIADPLYRPALPDGAKFIALPHEGYSGRIWRKDIPMLIGEGFNEWIEREMSL